MKAEMERKRSYTFYCRSSGVEVSLATRPRGKGYSVGCVKLRFFLLEPGTKDKQIVVMLSPEEAVGLSRLGMRLFGSAASDKKRSVRLIHHELPTHTTVVTADVFVHEGTRRVGLTAQRKDQNGTRRIPVVFTDDGLELFQALMKELAVEACFEVKDGSVQNQTRGAAEDPALSDELDDPWSSFDAPSESASRSRYARQGNSLSRSTRQRRYW